MRSPYNGLKVPSIDIAKFGHFRAFWRAMSFEEKIIKRALKLYVGRTSAKKVRDQLKEEFGLSEDELPDETTIRRWRKKALCTEHLDHMVRIAKLIIDGWERITVRTTQSEVSEVVTYVVVDKGKEMYFDFEALASGLKMSVEYAYDDFKESDIELLQEHLEPEFPRIESQRFMRIAEEKPYELIMALKRLVQDEGNVGKCQYCIQLN